MRETSYALRERRTRERAALIAAHGNVCGICGNPPKTRALHVDHDHKTGEVRGLLCFQCNRRLWVGCSVTWCVRAAVYLLRARVAPPLVGGGSSG